MPAAHDRRVEDDIFTDLLAAVEQQLVSPQTRYVAKTCERLRQAGLAEDAAKRQIALCLGEEMERVLKTKRAFDERAYRAALDELPLADEGEPTEDVPSPS